LRAGLTGDALASQTGLSQSKVSRVERGQSLPSVDELQRWASATKTSKDELTELADLVEQVATTATSWRVLHRLGLREKQAEVAGIERQAEAIHVFQPTMVPGLLQIAEYARRVLEISYSPIDVAQAVAVRMERQTILYDQSKRFEFIITEPALHYSPGPADIMPAQFDRLISVTSLPNVELRIIPAAAPGTMPHLHPFVLFEGPETLANVETYSAEVQVRDAEGLERYRHVLGLLREAGISGDAAIRLLTSMQP
jgi:transcriptional regulator with XRE-family HTH domain